MSGIYVEAKVRLSDIVAVIAKHHPETVLPAGWQDDPGMVVFDCVRVRSDDALAEISQSEIDEASSYSFADDDDEEMRWPGAPTRVPGAGRTTQPSMVSH